MLFIMPCLGQIVKTASLLSAISELDLNVMAHVLEDTQDRLNLLKVLRERILERIDHSDAKNNTPDLVVSNLFAVIDTDDSGELSKKEFGLFFALLDLNYSDEKFNHLFHTIDINKDGSISKQELCNMVFAGLNGGVFVKTTENVTADKADDVEALLKSSAELSLGYNEDESRWLSKHNIVGTGLIIPPSDPTVRKSFTSRQMSSREMNSDQSDDEDSGAKHAVRAATTVSADEIPKRRDSFDNQIEALEDIL